MNFIWDNTAPPVYIAPVNYQQAPKEIIDYNIAPIKTESPQSYTKAGDLPVQQKSENQYAEQGGNWGNKTTPYAAHRDAKKSHLGSVKQ